MPSRRITMQDIADACGLSRNTVSKVFNGRGSVPRTTRDLVLQKARELGYGTPVDEVQEQPVPAGNIALLTRSIPSQLHFGSAFKSAFTDQISRAGYTLKMYEISPEELKARRLPPHFVPEQTAGIVGIELFDKDYISMICHLGIPVVMADGPEDAGITLLECDYVTMENLAAFRERYLGFRDSLRKYGLRFDEEICIRDPDSSPYDNPDWLLSRIDRMPSLPDAFVCANDYLAFHLLRALKKRKIAVPEEVMVTGFDGADQSAFSEGFNQFLLFARSDRGGSAKITDTLAVHAPSQVARAAVSVFNFTVSGNAKTLGNSLVGLNFRHRITFISLKLRENDKRPACSQDADRRSLKGQDFNEPQT